VRAQAGWVVGDVDGSWRNSLLTRRASRIAVSNVPYQSATKSAAGRAIADENDADLAGGYQLAYDALRKSAAALLAVQGLRATSRGGHVAVQDAATAQFGRTVNAFKAFGRIRRARNTFEYPDTDSGGPTYDDVVDALDVARRALEAATTILDQNLLTHW